MSDGGGSHDSYVPPAAAEGALSHVLATLSENTIAPMDTGVLTAEVSDEYEAAQAAAGEVEDVDALLLSFNGDLAGALVGRLPEPGPVDGDDCDMLSPPGEGGVLRSPLHETDHPPTESVNLQPHSFLIPTSHAPGSLRERATVCRESVVRALAAAATAARSPVASGSEVAAMIDQCSGHAAKSIADLVHSLPPSERDLPPPGPDNRPFTAYIESLQRTNATLRQEVADYRIQVMEQRASLAMLEKSMQQKGRALRRLRATLLQEVVMLKKGDPDAILRGENSFVDWVGLIADHGLGGPSERHGVLFVVDQWRRWFDEECRTVKNAVQAVADRLALSMRAALAEMTKRARLWEDAARAERRLRGRQVSEAVAQAEERQRAWIEETARSTVESRDESDAWGRGPSPLRISELRNLLMQAGHSGDRLDATVLRLLPLMLLKPSAECRRCAGIEREEPPPTSSGDEDEAPTPHVPSTPEEAVRAALLRCSATLRAIVALLKQEARSAVPAAIQLARAQLGWMRRYADLLPQGCTLPTARSLKQARVRDARAVLRIPEVPMPSSPADVYVPTKQPEPDTLQHKSDTSRVVTWLPPNMSPGPSPRQPPEPPEPAPAPRAELKKEARKDPKKEARKESKRASKKDGKSRGSAVTHVRAVLRELDSAQRGLRKKHEVRERRRWLGMEQTAEEPESTPRNRRIAIEGDNSYSLSQSAAKAIVVHNPVGGWKDPRCSPYPLDEELRLSQTVNARRERLQRRVELHSAVIRRWKRHQHDAAGRRTRKESVAGGDVVCDVGGVPQSEGPEPPPPLPRATPSTPKRQRTALRRNPSREPPEPAAHAAAPVGETPHAADDCPPDHRPPRMLPHQDAFPPGGPVPAAMLGRAAH
eukprot:TRINITY_DN14313_c0_g1_i3.p1 TRINITY_DN14313_c0_g1~~TRINITY_DN14313_c0_g1_i3.p1  ORF type:complete len:880 (+),score=251.75 TRINITY_DN14313_c0_g1_i3:45-2684(+)